MRPDKRTPHISSATTLATKKIGIVNKHVCEKAVLAADLYQTEQLNLEAHARLKTRLIDNFPASDPVSAAQLAPAMPPSSIWQLFMRLFRWQPDIKWCDLPDCSWGR
jgi:hypothetical protein